MQSLVATTPTVPWARAAGAATRGVVATRRSPWSVSRPPLRLSPHYMIAVTDVAAPAADGHGSRKIAAAASPSCYNLPWRQTAAAAPSPLSLGQQRLLFALPLFPQSISPSASTCSLFPSPTPTLSQERWARGQRGPRRDARARQEPPPRRPAQPAKVPLPTVGRPLPRPPVFSACRHPSFRTPRPLPSSARRRPSFETI